ncbi:MAG: restriction endonuclease subunit S [Pseudoalteromonas nigrifaciens]|uniref:restriction endonuclease subunit S n=1 Tax=Pseudoalteromonas nigrifaciens TaxID=28109 RepID=UPI003F9A2416
MSELKASKYQAYSEYKDSGVEWLGKVPEHWEVKRISYFALLKSGDSIVSEQIEVEGDYPVYGGNGHRGYTNRFNHDGRFILIGRQGALCGNINYGYGKFWASEHAVVVHPTLDVNIKWLGETLRAMDLNQYNVSAAQPGLAVANITCLKAPFPKIDEQKSIANFLDHETAKIDTLIEKQQQLIKLLKEKRQAVISHAVTKGLNPQAPMKDSGVEWLGKVPEHWVICRLKNALTIRNGRDYKQVEVESGGYPVYGSGGVFKRSSKYLFDGSSVLFGRKGTIDKPLVVSGKFWTVDTMFYSEINTFHEAKYIYYQASMFPFSLLSTSTALPSMTQEDLLNLGFVSPPLTEQQKIVEYLKIKLDRFEVLISKVEQSIILSKERRTALISAAVTGEIDVRHWEQPND